MAYDVNQVVAKYIELRDACDAEVKANGEAIQAKYGEPMAVIEKWLLNFMETNGIDNIKTPSGTPYKAIQKSVKMQDSSVYRQYIFLPLIDTLANYIRSIGGEVPDLQELLQNAPKWDMVDFRPLKKGVVEHAEETGELPPGVTLDHYTTINIRRS